MMAHFFCTSGHFNTILHYAVDVRGFLQWGSRLEDVWKGKPRDSLDLALVDVREVYPTLPIEPFKVSAVSTLFFVCCFSH